MTTATGPTTRTVEITAPSPIERYGYLFMRLSGVALVFLAIGHMMIQHVVNDVHNLTIDFVRQQWSSWGWRTYDFFLLIFAIVHGFNGLRTVLEDYIHGDGAVRAIRWILTIIMIITLIWAGYAILSFNPGEVLVD